MVEHLVIVDAEADKHKKVPKPGLQIGQPFHRVTPEVLPPAEGIAGEDARHRNSPFSQQCKNPGGGVPHTVEHHRFSGGGGPLPDRLPFAYQLHRSSFSIKKGGTRRGTAHFSAFIT